MKTKKEKIMDILNSVIPSNTRYGKVVFRIYENGVFQKEEMTDPDPHLEMDIIWVEDKTYE